MYEFSKLLSDQYAAAPQISVLLDRTVERLKKGDALSSLLRGGEFEPMEMAALKIFYEFKSHINCKEMLELLESEDYQTGMGMEPLERVRRVMRWMECQSLLRRFVDDKGSALRTAEKQEDCYVADDLLLELLDECWA